MAVALTAVVNVKPSDEFKTATRARLTRLEPPPTRLRKRLVDAMEHAGRQIDSAAYAARPWRARVLDRLALALVRSALWLTGKTY